MEHWCSLLFMMDEVWQTSAQISNRAMPMTIITVVLKIINHQSDTCRQKDELAMAFLWEIQGWGCSVFIPDSTILAYSGIRDNTQIIPTPGNIAHPNLPAYYSLFIPRKVFLQWTDYEHGSARRVYTCTVNHCKNAPALINTLSDFLGKTKIWAKFLNTLWPNSSKCVGDAKMLALST